MPASEFVIFPTPYLAVKGAVCQTCYKAAPQLNKCSKCKRVFYCSQECQKKDWKENHKVLCTVLRTINDLNKEQAPRTWEEYRKEMWLRVDVFRQYRLTSNDERVMLYEPHCAKCHRTAFQLKSDETLQLCKTCHLAHVCSACPSDSHTAQCPIYQEVSIAEAFAIEHYLASKEVYLQMPTPFPRKTYLPLSAANSWFKYFTEISDKANIAEHISPELKPLAENALQMACALAAATDQSTMMLTILAALEKIFPDIATKSSLKLDLIGATAKELDALMMYEELLHLLPALKELHLTFIGPELPVSIEGEKAVSLDCCPQCTQLGRKRSMAMFRNTYQAYVASSRFSKPDLAVAFHTGHSQEAKEQWKPTIEHLAQADYPTVFTTFNVKEMKEETEGFKTLGTKFLVEGEKNIWKGMRPFLEVIEEKENSVYYNNQYWYIIAGKASSSSLGNKVEELD